MKKIVIGFGLVFALANQANAGYVTGVKKDGDVTVVKCSVGKDTRIYQNYGKCSDNYNMGSYSCESVMRWAKERCEKR